MTTVGDKTTNLDVYILRALVNDTQGHIFSDEVAQLYLDIAAKNVPYIAAALFCISRGMLEMANSYLRFAGLDRPIEEIPPEENKPF